MELERAQGLISAVFAAGKVRATRPLAAVVVDAGGHVVASARQDGATIARHDFALAKAWSSIALGLDTRELAQRAETNPAFFSAACTLFSGRLLPTPGGIVLRDGDIILGALGVSGNTGEADDACAEAAVRDVMALPT
ncbi:heme-binding protein [Aquamicrobium sp. LC103]|uniref:GlcG/HbpS family heme-binding protein n=1 Tax=Aquamicrobium sp. LC103 TaxID=1120658 RepID=UPI00063EA096|nr:heme-binding protein [Aquamicrobium sp. LC103]TKT75815.1 heme-binding protein [Aquamicrobium sp. LC103]